MTVNPQYVFTAYLNKLLFIRASLVAQRVKRLPAVRETWVRFPGQEDLLEKGMAYSLQYPCLENPMGRGAWWATVHGVAKNRT